MTYYIMLDIQVLALDRHKNVAALSQLMGSQPSLSTPIHKSDVDFVVLLNTFIKYTVTSLCEPKYECKYVSMLY